MRAGQEVGALTRAAALAIGLVIGSVLDIRFLDARGETDYWNAVEWTAIVVPLVVMLSIPRAPLPGWTWSSGAGGGKPRILVISWLLTGLILPWVLACLVADAAGEWFTNWWGRTHLGTGPGSYLWAVWLLTGVIMYMLASTVGVLATFLVDQWLAPLDDGSGDVQA
jgi:hypothetical protein